MAERFTELLDSKILFGVCLWFLLWCMRCNIWKPDSLLYFSPNSINHCETLLHMRIKTVALESVCLDVLNAFPYRAVLKQMSCADFQKAFGTSRCKKTIAFIMSVIHCTAGYGT